LKLLIGRTRFREVSSLNIVKVLVALSYSFGGNFGRKRSAVFFLPYPGLWFGAEVL